MESHMADNDTTIQVRRFLTTDVAIRASIASSMSIFAMLIAGVKYGQFLLAGFFLLMAIAFLFCVILAPAIEALRK